MEPQHQGEGEKCRRAADPAARQPSPHTRPGRIYWDAERLEIPTPSCGADTPQSHFRSALLPYRGRGCWLAVESEAPASDGSLRCARRTTAQARSAAAGCWRRGFGIDHRRQRLRILGVSVCGRTAVPGCSYESLSKSLPFTTEQPPQSSPLRMPFQNTRIVTATVTRDSPWPHGSRLRTLHPDPAGGRAMLVRLAQLTSAGHQGPERPTHRVRRLNGVLRGGIWGRRGRGWSRLALTGQSLLAEA